MDRVEGKMKCLNMECDNFNTAAENHCLEFFNILECGFNIRQEFDKVAETGTKFDTGKTDWSLLDLELIEPLIPVLKLGEQRYGFLNWKKDFGPDYSRRFRAARLRHEKACQYDSLAKNADDGDVYHLAQVAINALFELWHARKKEKHS
jgi:hypothetical protein